MRVYREEGLCGYGKPIDHDERRAGCSKRTRPVQANGTSLRGFARVAEHREPRHSARNAIERIGGGVRLHCPACHATHPPHGTAHLFARPVPHYHHLLYGLGRGAHGYVDLGAFSYLYLLALHAHVEELQHCV